MIDEKFLRTEILIGAAAMDRLKYSIVAVFGIGGVGSYTVEALARAGVGHLVLIDYDTVDVTNINRQIHATVKTIGQSKVQLMRNRVKEINPDIQVEIIEKKYLPNENVEEFFIDNYDYVVDAIDTISSKINLVIECQKRNLKIISSMGAGNKLDPTKFQVSDIYSTSVDPIAKIMRKKLKALSIPKLKVVYSIEEPISNSTGTIGSISFVPSVAGLIIAGEVIKDIAEVKR